MLRFLNLVHIIDSLIFHPKYFFHLYSVPGTGLTAGEIKMLENNMAPDFLGPIK